MYHSAEYVIRSIETDNRLRYDSYVAWRWVDPDDSSNNRFEYTIIHRAFNNYVSNDSITVLPRNALNCDNYVHTNQSCSVVWSVDNVGNMMWVYDPYYSIKEKYYVDDSTGDITIDRTQLTWSDVDISTNNQFSLVDENGKMAFNIYSNNPIQVEYTKTDRDPIYQQPTFGMIVSQGTPVADLHKMNQPIGNWRLVFPRVNNYHLSNASNGITYDALKMDVIRGSDLSTVGDVTNSEGRIVNKKVLVIDQTYNGNKLKVWNSQTNSWDII